MRISYTDKITDRGTGRKTQTAGGLLQLLRHQLWEMVSVDLLGSHVQMQVNT